MSTHVFSLLFKVLLNSTLSWWKTICFVGLVLLCLNARLGKQQSRCMGASGMRSSWDGGKRDNWGTWQAVGLPLLGSCYQPSWREKSLAGWEVLRWGCKETCTSAIAWPPHEWNLHLESIFRPLPSPSPQLEPYSFWTALPNFMLSLFSSAIRMSCCKPVLSSLVFSLSSCDSLNSVITVLTHPLETPSSAPLLIFQEFDQVLNLISFPGFSTLHLWITSSRNNVEVIVVLLIHRPTEHLLPHPPALRFHCPPSNKNTPILSSFLNLGS